MQWNKRITHFGPSFRRINPSKYEFDPIFRKQTLKQKPDHNTSSLQLLSTILSLTNSIPLAFRGDRDTEHDLPPPILVHDLYTHSRKSRLEVHEFP